MTRTSEPASPPLAPLSTSDAVVDVGNEVCPNTECKKINPGTTGTENTRTEVNSSTDGVGQT